MNNTFSCKDIVILICLYFSAVASLMADSVNRIALYVALPVAFILSYFKGDKSKDNYALKYSLLLFGWIFISALWAKDSEWASYELHRVLGSILLSYVMAVNAKKQKMIPWLYFTYIVLYLGVWYYATNHLILDVDLIGSDDERLNDDKLNANTMAYYTFYFTFIIFMVSEIVSNKAIVKICRILFWLIFPLSFYIALITASRQVLIIQVPLLLLLMYDRYIKGTNVNYKIVFITIFIILCVLCLPMAINYIDNSYLGQRSQIDLNDDSRIKLLSDAFSVGCSNLPFGVGAGNYIEYSYNHHFSHISYLELFANQGILGVLLYLYLIITFTVRQWKRNKCYNDKTYFLFFIFGVVFIIDNMFYVFYTDLWLISFFVLVATHSETYYNSMILQEKK